MCYRRLDSEEVVDRIYESFEAAFPKEALFRDIDTIPAGVDFRDYIQEALRNCQVVLVFIGRDWLGLPDERGARRLDDPGDHVRIEAETALQIPGLRVIPVLVRRATMPTDTDLPASLASLAFRNAITVRTGADYHGDVARLIGAVETALEEWQRENVAKEEEARKTRLRTLAPESKGGPPVESDLQLPPGTVYISHAFENRNAARRLAEALESGGIHTWSTQFEYAEPAVREANATKALEQCAMFLPLISQHTERHIDGFFRREWKFAVARARVVVPVIIDPMEPHRDYDVLLVRHYGITGVPLEFNDLPTMTCLSGRMNAELVSWVHHVVNGAGNRPADS
ncbi:MAG TPA: toll/interleukin-1 receptor domain-containing protein [Chthoniobacterales bacterium]|nr:toll/interleukin-1 receptor domain-containing protein [Chthoniobacterales bacterium]